jgi:hypothetical protein
MARTAVCSQPRQIVHETPISKITRAKWTGSLAQAVELLLYKHEASISIPISTKIKIQFGFMIFLVYSDLLRCLIIISEGAPVFPVAFVCMYVCVQGCACKHKEKG